jgi:hypothetical protein
VVARFMQLREHGVILAMEELKKPASEGRSEEYIAARHRAWLTENMKK